MDMTAQLADVAVMRVTLISFVFTAVCLLGFCGLHSVRSLRHMVLVPMPKPCMGMSTSSSVTDICCSSETISGMQQGFTLTLVGYGQDEKDQSQAEVTSSSSNHSQTFQRFLQGLTLKLADSVVVRMEKISLRQRLFLGPATILSRFSVGPTPLCK